MQELLNQGVIRPSFSSMRLTHCLSAEERWHREDVRGLLGTKKVTVENHYPLPRIYDLLDQLKNAIYFTKLDLRSGYHQVRIAEQVVWKTAFKTKQGLFEWMVMPFRVCNAPTTFMRVMNDLFRPFIDEFVLVYLDIFLSLVKTGINM